MRKISILLAGALLLSSCSPKSEVSLSAGEQWTAPGNYENMSFSGRAKASDGAKASIWIAADKGCTKGYEILIGNGEIDGSRKTGSLASVRNLYRSLAKDGEWFDFNVSVRGKNISVAINDVDVVCYTEPENPFRTEEHKGQRIGKGKVLIKGTEGTVEFSGLKLEALPAQAVNPCDTLPPVDEQNDQVIRLQQVDFPVIDWHVHLKGGLTKEMAHAMSMNYGINYGVAPNAGEGGVGRMLADDAEVYSYYEEVKDEPFLFGVQGEGRKWTQVFSQEALGIFEYLFTDAMTIIDHKGRNSRIYRAEEVRRDGLTKDQYMEQIVRQTELILTNEPADMYANATYIPDDMNDDYSAYWTDERVDRVLDVLEKNSIALEINARYKIPSYDIIRKAKARGIKFTFGTNNVNADFGRLEYAIGAIDACGLTVDDMWFPSMSVRASRPVVIYNHFPELGK